MFYLDIYISKYRIPGKKIFVVGDWIRFFFFLAHLIILSVTFSSCAILFPSRPVAHTNFRDYMEIAAPCWGECEDDFEMIKALSLCFLHHKSQI